MHDDGHTRGHGGTGPPSARARQQLSADLRRELADARLRLQEASLRAEAHRLLGDAEAAADALREQQTLLGDLEHRLGRSVSAAILQREAEDVVAGVQVPTADVAPVLPPRRPVLSGVASLVIALALASMAILGQAPGSVSVLDVSDEADRDRARVPVDPSTDPTDPANAPRDGSPSTSATTPAPGSGAASGPAGHNDRGTVEDGPTDDGTTNPGQDDQLDELVTQLDAVADSLDVPAQLPSPPPTDEPSPEVTTDETDPSDPDTSIEDDEDDGFVPATGAQ